MPAVRLLLVSVLVVLASAPGAALAAAGDPDPAFSDDGDASYTFGYGGAVAALAQGTRTLLVGSANVGDDSHIAIARVTAAGAPDASFAPGGRILLPAESGSGAADAVALPGGDIVVAGNAPPSNGDAIALTRLNADGTIDASFGDDGVALIDATVFGPSERARNMLTAIALRAQGDALVVGVNYVSANDDFASWSYLRRVGAIRLNVDSGAPDLTFGVRGGAAVVVDPAYSTWGNLQDIAIQPIGGKIVLAEALLDWDTAGDRVGVYRLDSDGVLDDSFGDGGRQVVQFLPGETSPDRSEWPNALQPLADGGVAVAGTASTSLFPRKYRGVVAKLDATGDLDASFGDDGIATSAPTEIGERGFDALTLIDGKLYAGGHDVRFDEESIRQRSQGWIVRFDDHGVDPSFGTAGSSLVGYLDVVNEIFDAGNGFVSIAGVAGLSEYARWMLARADRQAERLPQNTGLPVVQAADGGFGEAGETITADDGTWWYAGAVTRQWQRCETEHAGGDPAAADCVDIADAMAVGYVATDADRGAFLRVVVTATSGTLHTRAASATLEVLDLPDPVVMTGTPQIAPSGTVPSGTVLRVSWTASGDYDTTVVTWWRCANPTGGPCAPIAGDDDSDDAYTTTSADLGSYLVARVELSGPGGYASRDAADAVAVTAAGGSAPASTGAPAITPTGSVAAGTTLRRASDGSWDALGLTFTYRWERCTSAASGCVAIPGAGGAEYVTGAADAGRFVRLVVSARQGAGPVADAGSATTAVTAAAPPAVGGGGGGGGGGATPAPATPPAPPATPTTPSSTPPVVTMDTRTTATMPEVRGLKIDEARARIKQAGIHALIDSEEKIRAKPLQLPGQGRLDIGDVSAQSLSAGTPVVSSVGEPKRIRLITEAGPKATKPLGPECTGKPFRDDLRGLALSDVEALLHAKGCRRIERDFVVSKQATSLEVRRATKGDDALELTVVVPGDPANLDLTPVFRQGAFNGNPSFGKDDWALTAGTMNIFGVQAITRANQSVADVEVFVDASNVGAEDIHAKANGAIFVRGIAPTRAGVVNVLLQQQDGLGNAVFGFGRFRVVERNGSFVAIDGNRYGSDGRRSPAARAAGFAEILAGLGRLAQDLGANIASIFSGPVTEGTLSTAARQNVGLAQLSLGALLNGSAQVVAAGGGNVVAAGGANVVAAGGGNVVAAGGGNLVALARGNVVAAGGGNLLGRDTIANGSGQLLAIPANVVAAGGANVVAAGGGNVIAAGGGNVIAAGGGNVIAAGGGNVVAAGGLN